jgi:hypothetical protein
VSVEISFLETAACHTLGISYYSRILYSTKNEEIHNKNSYQIWLVDSGCELIFPNQPTSKRSSSIIDFGITHDAQGWKAETLKDGSSDHYPVFIQAPLSAGLNSFFRKTNWKIFSFFLRCVFPYFNSLVYNLDPDTFFYFSLRFFLLCGTE